MLTLDKAQTKALIDKVVDRVGEEIKDERLNDIFGQMVPPEEGKEAILIKDAIECVLRYAVEIKMIPTRLTTALKYYSVDYT